MYFSSLIINVKNVVFFAILFSLPLFSLAQENLPTTDPVAVTTSENVSEEVIVVPGTVIAEINLSEATIIIQDNQELILSFLLENKGDTPQFDIRYGVELIKELEEGGQAVADSFVPDEVVSVPALGTLTKVVTYPLATVPAGDYSVWITARTTGGTMLGLGNAGSVSITNGAPVEIMSSSCVLSIEGGEDTYNLLQGVDVASAENLILNCTLKNNTNRDLTVLPTFETFKRSVFGEKFEMDYPNFNPINIKAATEQNLTLTLPKATLPQAYDIAMTLSENGADASNRLVVHYVLQGASATIQTLNFSQNYYDAGEEINLELLWTGSADSFPDSRLGTSTDLEGLVVASVSIVDGEGNACAAPFSQTLDSDKVTLKTISNIECVSPVAFVSLIKADGTTLDARSIVVPKNMEPEAPAPTETEPEKNAHLMYLTILSLAAAILTVLVVLTRYKKVVVKDVAKMLIITSVATASFLGANIEKVEAVSWWGQFNYCTEFEGGSYCTLSNVLNYTVNTNKSVYTPGESISLSSATLSPYCANQAISYTLTASLQGQLASLANNSNVNGGGVSVRYSSASLVAPSSPGVYVINLSAQTFGFRAGVSSQSITITVVAPPPPTVTVNGFNPSTITAGQNSTIGFTSTNATACFGTGPFSGNLGGTNTPGQVFPPASVLNTPGTYTQTVYCTGPGGNSPTVSRTLTVLALPPTLNLTASPTSITQGQSTTLTWSSTNVTSCTASGGTGFSGGVPVNSSRVTSPTVTTTYNLNCSGPGGPISRSVTVVVSAAPPLPPTNLSATAQACGTGQNFLDWNDVSGATSYSVYLSNGTWLGNSLGSNYTHNGAIATSYSYYVRANNSAGVQSGNSSVVSGTTAAACAPTPTPTPSGNISVSGGGCQIQPGQTSCNVFVNWNSSNFIGSSNIQLNSTSINSASNSSAPGLSQTLQPGTNTFRLSDSGSSFSRSASATVTCAGGGVWTGTTCELLPEITLSAIPNLVRSGTSAEVGIQVNSTLNLTCRFNDGRTGVAPTFTHTGSAGPVTHPPITTKTLTAAQDVTVTCTATAPGLSMITDSETIRISVVPTVQEI
jgi:hypothetical protein